MVPAAQPDHPANMGGAQQQRQNKRTGIHRIPGQHFHTLPQQRVGEKEHLAIGQQGRNQNRDAARHRKHRGACEADYPVPSQLPKQSPAPEEIQQYVQKQKAHTPGSPKSPRPARKRDRTKGTGQNIHVGIQLEGNPRQQRRNGTALSGSFTHFASSNCGFHPFFCPYDL